jgi:hypothetical protein
MEMVDALGQSSLSDAKSALAAFESNMGGSLQQAWSAYGLLVGGAFPEVIAEGCPAGLVQDLQDLPGRARDYLALGGIGVAGPLAWAPIVIDHSDGAVFAPLAPFLDGYLSYGWCIAVLDHGVGSGSSAEAIHDVIDKAYFTKAVSGELDKTAEAANAKEDLDENAQKSRWEQEVKKTNGVLQLQTEVADRLIVCETGTLAVEWKVRPSSLYFRDGAAPTMLHGDLGKLLKGASQSFAALDNTRKVLGYWGLGHAVVVIPGPSWLTPPNLGTLAGKVENWPKAPPQGVLSVVDLHELRRVVVVARRLGCPLTSVLQAWRFDPVGAGWPLARFLAARVRDWDLA